MAWIESHQSLGSHRKTWALARLLKTSIPTAIGHLHMMWWWALDNTPDGLLEGVTPDDLARACQWKGEPDRLWNALCESGFITGDPPELHDWNEYAGKLITRREKNRENVAAYRSRKHDVSITSPLRKVPTVPTVPTQPTVPTPLPPAVTGGGEVFTKWEKEIGMLSPTIAEKVGWLIDEQGETRVIEAIDIAAKANARSLRYIEGIFERAGKGPLELPRRTPLGDTGGGQRHVRKPEEFRRGRDADLLDAHAQLRAEAKAAGFDSVPAYIQHLDEERLRNGVSEADSEQGEAQLEEQGQGPGGRTPGMGAAADSEVEADVARNDAAKKGVNR